MDWPNGHCTYEPTSSWEAGTQCISAPRVVMSRAENCDEQANSSRSQARASAEERSGAARAAAERQSQEAELRAQRARATAEEGAKKINDDVEEMLQQMKRDLGIK